MHFSVELKMSVKSEKALPVWSDIFPLVLALYLCHATRAYRCATERGPELHCGLGAMHCRPGGPYWEKLCPRPQAEGRAQDQGHSFSQYGPT